MFKNWLKWLISSLNLLQLILVLFGKLLTFQTCRFWYFWFPSVSKQLGLPFKASLSFLKQEMKLLWNDFKSQSGNSNFKKLVYYKRKRAKVTLFIQIGCDFQGLNSISIPEMACIGSGADITQSGGDFLKGCILSNSQSITPPHTHTYTRLRWV